jgi:hypothetical protein
MRVSTRGSSSTSREQSLVSSRPVPLMKAKGSSRGDPHLPDFLKDVPELRRWREAHDSISIQELHLLHELLSFRVASFHAYLRGLAVACHGGFAAETVLRANSGRCRHENLSGAISWLTFFAGGAADAMALALSRERVTILLATLIGQAIGPPPPFVTRILLPKRPVRPAEAVPA